MRERKKDESPRMSISCAGTTANGQPCKRWASLNGYCKDHTGPMISPKLPERIRSKAEQALADPELTSTRTSIAILEALLDDKYEQLGEEAPVVVWQQAMEAFFDMRKEIRSATGRRTAEMIEVREKVEAALKIVEDVFRTGRSKDFVELRIREIFQEQANLRDRETRRIKELERYLDPQQMQVILQQVIVVIHNNVPDPNAKSAIAAELGRILSYWTDSGDTAGTSASPEVRAGALPQRQEVVGGTQG